MQGSASLNGGVWTVTGSGAGIGGTNDEAHFAATEVSGDFTLVARLLTISGGATTAQAGVMVRQDRTHYSRQMYAGFVASGSLERQSIDCSRPRRHSAAASITCCPPDCSLSIPANFQEPELHRHQRQCPRTEQPRHDSAPERERRVDTLGRRLPRLHHRRRRSRDAAALRRLCRGGQQRFGGRGNAHIFVSLSAPATAPVTVDYSVTAGASADFDLPSGTLNFAVGETVKTISVTVNQDTLVDPPKTRRSPSRTRPALRSARSVRTRSRSPTMTSRP